jgi:hypothetical protein
MALRPIRVENEAHLGTIISSWDIQHIVVFTTLFSARGIASGFLTEAKAIGLASGLIKLYEYPEILMAAINLLITVEKGRGWKMPSR